MRILFLDQSRKLGGAELCLADIAQHFSPTSTVGVFTDGAFPDHLRQLQIPVAILTQQELQVRKASGLLAGLKSLNHLIPLIAHVTHLSRQYDLIYANTQKALVVGAIASQLSRRPLVYHLHDIVSPDHFSRTNRRLIITLANRAALVIANSQASRHAFIQAGGRADRVNVVYNGFNPAAYPIDSPASQYLRQQLDWGDRFVVGHFSRLSPWKGQHILIDALRHCPDHVVALLVGDALFGETDYVAQLHHQVQHHGLQHRVQFLGFRSDIPALMGACDLIAHTSTAPEPFGRVIVEAMLCQRPVVAAAAGGAIELIDHGVTGWLTPPEDVSKLAEVFTSAYHQPERSAVIAQAAQHHAQTHFDLATTNGQISSLLHQIELC
jgi:glycosyltransferase involved in cell wall biosynthesis